MRSRLTLAMPIGEADSTVAGAITGAVRDGRVAMRSAEFSRGLRARYKA